MTYRELLPEKATRGDLATSFEIPAAPRLYPASIPEAPSSTFYVAPGRLSGWRWPGRFIHVASRSEGLVAGVQCFRGDGWLQIYVLPEGNIMARSVAPPSDTPPAELSTFPANTFPLASCLANPLIHFLRDERPLQAHPSEVIANPGSRASLIANFDIPQARQREGVWNPAPGSFYGSHSSIVVVPGSIQRDDGIVIGTPHPLSQNGATVYPPDSNLVFALDIEFPEIRAEGRCDPLADLYQYSGYVVWNAGEDAAENAFPLYRIRTDSLGRVVELEDVRPILET